MNSSQVAGFGYFVRSDFGQADMMMSGVVTPGQVEILIVPQISGVVSSKAAPYRNRSAPGGELASLGLTHAPSQLLATA
jgi:hypothetical protein